MEEKLSFIPRKSFEPTTSYKVAGWGIAVTFCFLVFLAVAITGGGMMLYRNSLQTEIDELKKSLAAEEKILEPNTINNLIQTSDKISAAQELLANHKSILGVFKLLEETTLKDIRFKSMNFSAKDGMVSLDGASKSYSMLALQGDEFEKNDKSIKDFSFSNLALGEKGLVSFSAKLQLLPSVLKYNTGQEE